MALRICPPFLFLCGSYKSSSKTIERLCGEQINLRTIRPLSLKEPLIAGRMYNMKTNDLADSMLPRISATVGMLQDFGIGNLVLS
jgi:hypothetical protein